MTPMNRSMSRAQFLRTCGGSMAVAWLAARLNTADVVPRQPVGLRTVPKGHRFTHPGLLNSLHELDFIRTEVQQGKEPRTTEFAHLSKHRLASLDFVTKPVAIVDTDWKPGSHVHSASEEANAAHAAYAHALQWFVLRDDRHARKAIEILNAWGATLQGHTGGNRGLQAGWVAPVFCRAAEIIRYTYRKWPAAEQSRFSEMLRTVLLPLVIKGVPCTAGNWELSYTEAVLSIGVFNDDVATFNRGLTLLQRRIPCFFYVSSDGPLPRVPEPEPGVEYAAWSRKAFASYQTEAGLRQYWYRPAGDGPFYDGQCQETCRDLLHTQMGLAAACNGLEIALTQGVDLYSVFAERVIKGMEFAAKYLLGAPVPPDLCGGALKWADKREQAWELGYNHYHFRQGRGLPLSGRVVEDNRARRVPIKLHMAWETFTHANLPAMKQT